MNFFKKLFNIPIREDEEIHKQEVNLSLDDLFVHNFTKKGGKFLYCEKKQEVLENFKKILTENSWKEVCLLDENLFSFLKSKTFDEIKSYFDSTIALVLPFVKIFSSFFR